MSAPSAAVLAVLAGTAVQTITIAPPAYRPMGSTRSPPDHLAARHCESVTAALATRRLCQPLPLTEDALQRTYAPTVRWKLYHQPQPVTGLVPAQSGTMVLPVTVSHVLLFYPPAQSARGQGLLLSVANAGLGSISKELAALATSHQLSPPQPAGHPLPPPPPPQAVRGLGQSAISLQRCFPAELVLPPGQTLPSPGCRRPGEPLCC